MPENLQNAARPKRLSRIPLAFVVTAYIFTWFFELIVVFESMGTFSLPFEPKILLVVGIFGPFFSAFFWTWKDDGFPAVRRLFKRGFAPGGDWRIYFFVACVPIFITCLADLLAGGGRANLEFSSLLVTFIIYFFLGGSFGEEFGWRGYALPRLLDDYQPLTASLILGIFWAGWHLPLFWLPGTSQFSTPLGIYIIYIASLSILYSWIYLKTGGNIFVCLLFHTFVNITVEIFPIETNGGADRRFFYETLLTVITAAVVVLFQPAFFRKREPSGSYLRSRNDTET